MKSTKAYTYWNLFIIILYTIHTSVSAIFKHALGQINRQWVNQSLQQWVQRVVKRIRLSCRVYNPHNVAPIPGQPTIIMCNHSSLFDIPLSLYAFPDISIRMLAKAELFKIPLFGRAMRASEFPIVHRQNRGQAIKDLEAVAQLLKSGIVMWIAPEGTRSADGKLGHFKKGGFITAIQTQATIIPIGIVGANRILPARTKQLALDQSAEVHIGQPINAAAYSLDQKDALIAVVRNTMQALIQEHE